MTSRSVCGQNAEVCYLRMLDLPSSVLVQGETYLPFRGDSIPPATSVSGVTIIPVTMIPVIKGA